MSCDALFSNRPSPILPRLHLRERRPVNERARMAAMLEHSNLVITAREGDLLAGVSRCGTGFSHATCLSGPAARLSHQRTVILPSARKAVGYYPRIGFTQHNSAWILRLEDRS